MDIKERGVMAIYTITNRTFIGMTTESNDDKCVRLVGYMVIDGKVPCMDDFKTTDKIITYYIPHNNIDYIECNNTKDSRLLCEYSITEKGWNKFITKIKDEVE